VAEILKPPGSCFLFCLAKYFASKSKQIYARMLSPVYSGFVANSPTISFGRNGRTPTKIPKIGFQLIA